MTDIYLLIMLVLGFIVMAAYVVLMLRLEERNRQFEKSNIDIENFIADKTRRTP